MDCKAKHQRHAGCIRINKHMKPQIVIGIALIVLGALALIYQGITYTTRETIVDIGPIEATAERERTVPLPPILGAIALIGGIVLVVTAGRKSA